MKGLNCKISTIRNETIPPPAPVINRGRGDLHRWASFLSGIFLIFIFVSVIAPWILELPYIKPVNDVIQERGIEANLYDYTEVELFADAEFFMRHALEDSPKDTGYIISIVSGVLLFSLAMWIGYKYILPDRNKQ